MIPAHQTVDQLVYWGDTDLLVDVGPILSGVPIASELSLSRRVVLGSAYATARVARVAYRVSAPRMEIGTESETIRLNPEAILAIIRTDDNRAMVMPAVISGIPETAASQGELIANVPFSPAGRVHRCTATNQIGAGNIDVVDGEAAWAIVTVAAAGNITRGALNVSAASVGVKHLGNAGDAVGIPVGATAWIVSGPEAKA